MSVYPSVTKSVFRSVHPSLKVPPAIVGSSGGGGAFDPDLSGIQSRILDGGTIWTDEISSKYYLKDQSTDNTHLPRQGRAWLFDGTNDYGAIGNSLVSGTSDFTISIWVKPTNFSIDRAILATYSAGNTTGFDLYITTSGTVTAYSSLGSRGCVTALTAGVWNHLVVTRSSGTLTFYKDSVNAGGSGAYNHNLGSASNMKVGSVSGTSEFFLGSLRDVRIYSSAKDSTAVAAIYNQSRTGNGTFDETNLVVAYPCNEEAGATGYDISGNANHLTLTNITEATFHATDTGVLTNRNNDDGYRLGVNLAKYSEDLTNSVWLFSNIGSVTVANQTTAPDGAVSADLVREDTSTGSHRLWRYENPVLTTGVRYTFSIYLKASGRTKIEFAGDSIFTVDLVAETNTNGTITSIGNGWYRVSSTFVATGTVSSHYCLLNNGSTNSYTGDGSSGMYIWGGQIEVGSIATTYQPTQSTGIAGRYIPKRLSSSLAADGNALTVTGRAAYHGCAEVPCLAGANTVYASVGTHSLTGDFELSFWCRYIGDTADGYGPMFLGGGDFAGGVSYQSYIWYRPSVNILYWACDGESHVITGGIANSTLDDNQWHKIKVTRSGTTHTFLLDDVVLWTGTKTVVTMTVRQILQSFLSAYYLVGNMADLRITHGGVTTYFPLQDGPGSSNTNRDIAYVKSDGTGGVISNAIVNGTVSTIWGNRVPGQVKDWCVENGGRIGAAGEYIAGLIGSANAADGNAKTLSAGKYGNPYSRLNSNPATAAEYNGKGVQTSYEDIPCFTRPNGVSAYGDIDTDDLLTANAFTLRFWVKYSAVGSGPFISKYAVGGYNLTFGFSSGLYWFCINNGTKLLGGSAASGAVNTWHKIELIHTPSSGTISDITLNINGVSATLVDRTVNSVTPNGNIVPLRICSSDAGLGGPIAADISLSNIEIVRGGITKTVPLSDGSGADLAWYKSDGTSGVTSNALQGTLTNVWANKTDGSKVPAIKYSLRAIVTRETKFNRVASDGDDRFLTYESALSGGDLTNVETYVT